MSNMRRTQELGADFWNDSCDLRELGEAVECGAVGATSNPVIVTAAVSNDRARWQPVLAALCRENGRATEDELAWLLIERIAVEAAALLQPVHDRTEGRKGFLSVQVNPKAFNDAGRMVEQAKHLASLAPNIAIKVPLTEAGLEAAEEITAAGVNINGTVSFSVSQAVAVAEALERGLARAQRSGMPMHRLHPYVTIMVGRVDDHLRRVMDARYAPIDPGHLHWGGVAVFKRARSVFVERGFRSTLLAAAYRHVLHWSELVGDGVVLSMPYEWWRRFEASAVVPERTLERPVDDRIVSALYGHFEDFRRAYDPDGLRPAEFRTFGPSVHTLKQFLAGYESLLAVVREAMLS